MFVFIAFCAFDARLLAKTPKAAVACSLRGYTTKKTQCCYALGLVRNLQM